jgi:serine/threonine-protein kinase
MGAVVEEPNLVGRTIAGRFTLTDRIGTGGFATVYRGVQDGGRLPRDVAVKIMKAELAVDERFLRRFQLEARAATRLEHPNSVRVLDSGVDGELAYIAMELLVGEDLCEVLHRDGRLSEARAARVVAEVCQALAAAHERGVVHRDLKPENIMLVRDRTFDDGERIKVLDFGVAKLVEPAVPPNQSKGVDPPSSVPSAITRTGTVMGTPSYMAPEQAMGEAVDARTDVYACGVLLYQLVTGRLPFDGDTPLSIVMQHIHRAAPSPRALVAAIHPGLEACILKALQKRAADRYQSARELEAELRALLPELAAARLPSIAPRAASGQKRREAGISPPFLRVGLDTPFSAVGSDQAITQPRELAPQAPAVSRPAASRNLDYVATPLVVPLPRESDEGGRPSQARRGVRVEVVAPAPHSDPRTGTMRSRRDELLAEVARLGKREVVPPREIPPAAVARKGLFRTGTLPQGQPLPKLYEEVPASRTIASKSEASPTEPQSASVKASPVASAPSAAAPASPAAAKADPKATVNPAATASPNEATAGRSAGPVARPAARDGARIGPGERGPDSMPASSSEAIEIPIVGRPRPQEPAAEVPRKRSDRRAGKLAQRDKTVRASERPIAREATDKRTAGPMQHVASTPPGLVIGIAVAVLLLALAYFTSR